MIIVKIHGGLGNQMFQYAFGANLAKKNQCALKLDLSFFDTQELRSYGLNHFNINAQLASKHELLAVKPPARSKPGQLIDKLFKPKFHIITENGLNYNPHHLKTYTTNVYIDGYWQSEKYFKEISAIIQKQFKPKTSPSPANSAMLHTIASVNSVSLHIRRGDFVKNKQTNHIHGVCLPDYYQKATDLLNTRTENPFLFVFSDDIIWAKENFKTKNDHLFVDINDEHSAFEDLRLIYSCNHHIIANSTFSWWAAWLNANPYKIVIAPKKWFNDTALAMQAGDILPQSWIKI